MLDYRNHIEAGSLLNTPPVIAIYICMLTLKWLKSIGGVKEAEQRNITKAQLLYDAIDELPLFKGTVNKEDRSKMNVCFIIENEIIEKEFLQLCDEENIIGIKGHRTVGGFRASLYNALPIESVQALKELMIYFANRKG